MKDVSSAQGSCYLGFWLFLGRFFLVRCGNIGGGRCSGDQAGQGISVNMRRCMQDGELESRILRLQSYERSGKKDEWKSDRLTWSPTVTLTLAVA